MAPHSSTLAWKIPWREEPGGLQSMGSLRVGHDWVTSLSLFTSCIGESNGNPLQCSCLENPRDGGAWWAAVYGVAQSRTRLKRLSSSSKAEMRESPAVGSKWEQNVAEPTPRASASPLPPPYPSPRNKPQPLQKCCDEGAVVSRWGHSKEGGWRWKPQH